MLNEFLYTEHSDKAFKHFDLNEQDFELVYKYL